MGAPLFFVAPFLLRRMFVHAEEEEPVLSLSKEGWGMEVPPARNAGINGRASVPS